MHHRASADATNAEEPQMGFIDVTGKIDPLHSAKKKPPHRPLEGEDDCGADEDWEEEDHEFLSFSASES